MADQTNKILTTVVLLAVGYCVGMAQGPEPANAQSQQAPETAENPGNDFVVVAGRASTSRSAPHYYYVVTADGTATKVLINGSQLHAPRTEFPDKLQLKHDLPSRVRLDHSGRITD